MWRFALFIISEKLSGFVFFTLGMDESRGLFAALRFSIFVQQASPEKIKTSRISAAGRERIQSLDHFVSSFSVPVLTEN